MNTTTTRKNETRSARLWSGQFHFLVSPECDISYLQGAMGGYVSAIATAPRKSEFVLRVMSALRERRLVPDDGCRDIHDISKSYRTGQLSDEWILLGSRALETDQVVFTTFDLYDSV